MIADRNRRQRRKWRRTCGGARRRCVASIGEYVGFDRFGRVIDHLWYAYAASADRARYTYGYDRASNRLYRENTLTSGKDELYGYDQLNRLIEFARGDLNNPKSAIENPKSAEDWSLDMTGNWPGYVKRTSGSTDLDQARMHNPVNEITAITATAGTDWADPVHDRNGNMTTIPKPASLANGLTATYDAWNRLVEVKDGQTVIARYDYDGLDRRIKSHTDSGAPSNPTGVDTYLHYYYNTAWQILETRQSDTESAQPETLQPKHQYVWSQRYIDAAVLRDENTGTNGLCDDQRLYYLNDANFNVTALLDTAGDAVERYLYSPYGVVTIYDATWTNTRSTSSYANVTLYTGRELDPETGLYCYRNRYYSAELGRFLSRDPIGYERGDGVELRRCDGGNASSALRRARLDRESDETAKAVRDGSRRVPMLEPIEIELYAHDLPLCSRTPLRTLLPLYEYVRSGPISLLDPSGQAWWPWRPRPPLVFPTKGDFFDRTCWESCRAWYPNPSYEIACCVTFCQGARKLVKKRGVGPCEGLWLWCTSKLKSNQKRNWCLKLYLKACPKGHPVYK